MRNFADRHIGPTLGDMKAMLETIGVPDVDSLIKEVVPDQIRREKPMSVGEPMTEREYLRHIRKIGEKNDVFSTFLGQGY